ncbi:DEAD-domain-containing protein [Panus rudis PR-1116 ss-1]|nr:DEAD-domain-containing protein [Panus rudis PR-1116 ss-1]
MAPKLSSKRKSHPSAFTSRKKPKTAHIRSATDLPWKSVPTTTEAGLETGFDGILELEEVEDVEVVYEETEGGKVARFKVVEKSDEESDGAAEGESDQKPTSRTARSSSPAPKPRPEYTFDSKSLLPNWHTYNLHPLLLRALYAQHFTTPTPIQSSSLPPALEGKDVIGVAETGSGKTLAYGLPVLHTLLREVEKGDKASGGKGGKKRPVRALVLTPTRELALQVSAHLRACLQDVDPNTVGVKQEDAEPSAIPPDSKSAKGKNGKPKSKSKGKGKEVEKPFTQAAPPPISVAAIVGGMSAHKQRRILDRGVDVLVATPGRLWDILQENDDLALQIRTLRFLVLDEADRMIETGHFAELDNILRLTKRWVTDQEELVQGDPAPQPDNDNDSGSGSDSESDAESSTMHNAQNDDHSNPDSKEEQMQTFVFSATLSKELQRNLKKRTRTPLKGKGKKAGSTIDDLLQTLDFRDPSPTIIDLPSQSSTPHLVSGLHEAKVEVLSKEKDLCLYWFLVRYVGVSTTKSGSTAVSNGKSEGDGKGGDGKTLVFLSSIDGVRRLVPLLELLGFKGRVWGLHGEMEMRVRLKNLDRFKQTPHSILLATDIASRGLDVPSVSHVIHYQIPRSADVYIHRNGRTARAMKEGFSLLMCAPEERRVLRGLMGGLGRDADSIPTLPLTHHILDKLKPRLALAKEIDSTRHRVQKKNHEEKWVREAAEALGVDIDDDDAMDAEETTSKKQQKQLQHKIASLKAELDHLLAQPLVVKGVSTRYITSGGCAGVLDNLTLVDGVLSGSFHEHMIGLPKTEARHDIDVAAAKKKMKNKQEKQEKMKKEKEGWEEKWGGINASAE